MNYVSSTGKTHRAGLGLKFRTIHTQHTADSIQLQQPVLSDQAQSINNTACTALYLCFALAHHVTWQCRCEPHFATSTRGNEWASVCVCVKTQEGFPASPATRHEQQHLQTAPSSSSWRQSNNESYASSSLTTRVDNCHKH